MSPKNILGKKKADEASPEDPKHNKLLSLHTESNLLKTFYKNTNLIGIAISGRDDPLFKDNDNWVHRRKKLWSDHEQLKKGVAKVNGSYIDSLDTEEKKWDKEIVENIEFAEQKAHEIEKLRPKH